MSDASTAERSTIPFDPKLVAIDSGRGRSHGTPGILKFQTSGTSALSVDEQKGEQGADILPAIPGEVTAPNMIRGKSLAQWGIERRRAAKALKRQWENDVAPEAGTPAFAVRVSVFLDVVNGLIQRYTGIHYEEVFSGMLQLARDALVGQNFVAADQGQLAEPIQNMLEIAASATELSMTCYDEALGEFIEAGLQSSQGG